MMFSPGTTAAQLSSSCFSDVDGHSAQQDIELVSSLGLMNGTGTTEQGLRVFSPEAAVSRAQLAAVLHRTFQLDYGQMRFFKQPLASDYYRDVDNTAWYADGLVMCMINNIFDKSDNFIPEQSVSRLEMARSIYRCFNSKGISIPMIMIMPIYDDTNSLSQEDINAITFVSNTGIMKGYDQYFRPEQKLKREELATILSRCISLMAINEDYNNKEYQVTVGQNFYVSLNSNPTTGYTWNIKNVNEKVLVPMGNAYRSNDYNNLLGQGGKEIWQFKALQAGVTELQLTYARPWESVQPAQIFALKVTVTQP
jgi:predicted secreted protein